MIIAPKVLSLDQYHFRQLPSKRRLFNPPQPLGKTITMSSKAERNTQKEAARCLLCGLTGHEPKSASVLSEPLITTKARAPKEKPRKQAKGRAK